MISKMGFPLTCKFPPKKVKGTWTFWDFTHPQVILNLHDFLSSAEHKKRYFEKYLSFFFSSLMESIVVLRTTDFQCMKQSSFVFQKL